MHLKKQGLQNIVPHSLTNCYGITGSDFVHLSHLHGKVMTGFATGENVTVVLQFCYAVWTAYGPTEYTDGLQHSNAGGEHKMGHTLGYYQTTVGAGRQEFVDEAGIFRSQIQDSFVSTYHNGDRGEPCARTGRQAHVKIRCTDRFGKCQAGSNIASNCTQYQLDYGGCLCNFEHVTSCASDITVLVRCGTPVDNKYIWWNWTDLGCWVGIILFIYFVLTLKSAAKVGAQTAIVPLLTPEKASQLWQLGTWIRTSVFGEPEKSAQDMGIQSRHIRGTLKDKTPV